MHRFSRRASPPNTKPPRDHRTCPYVVQFHFQDRSRRASSNTSLRSLISAIENARFTCHRSHAPLLHADSSAGVRYSARHRRVGLDGILQHSASPPSPGLDHERAEDSRRAIRRTTRGELASSPRRQPSSLPNNALRRRGGEARVTERVARVYQQRQAVLRLCLDDVARHSCPPGPRRSAVPAPAAVRVAAEAARRRGQL